MAFTMTSVENIVVQNSSAEFQQAYARQFGDMGAEISGSELNRPVSAEPSLNNIELPNLPGVSQGPAGRIGY